MMTERTAEHGPDSLEDPSRAEERVALLALGRQPKIGPQRSRMLVDHCGSARAALSAPDTDWEAVLGKSTLQRVNRSDNLHWAHEQLRRLEDRGGFLVAWGDRDYPSWLAEAADAPLSLYALGDRRLLQPPAVAIVGSRRCTSYGKRVSTQLGSDLATAGVTIVSGLARGIDGAAHEGALHAGGATIAVLGGGVDVIYPRDHAKLYRQIQPDGLLLAESPLGIPPERSSFPRRNRIVSGLAQAVIVVEAPERSGALMTARLAREQGREEFAVPGEITNPRYAGCLSLLRDGAGLSCGAKDVIDGLKVHLPTAWGDEMPQARSIDDANPLLEALQSGEHGVESLARQVGQSVGHVQEALLRLELVGRVVRLPGQRYARAG